jgi:hypothetical protein
MLKVCTDDVQINCIPFSKLHYISYARHTKSVSGRGAHRSRQQRNVSSGWNLLCVPQDIRSPAARANVSHDLSQSGHGGDSTRIGRYFRPGLRPVYTAPNHYENYTMRPFLFLLMLTRLFLSATTSLEPEVMPHGRSGHQSHLIRAIRIYVCNAHFSSSFGKMSRT